MHTPLPIRSRQELLEAPENNTRDILLKIKYLNGILVGTPEGKELQRLHHKLDELQAELDDFFFNQHDDVLVLNTHLSDEEE